MLWNQTQNLPPEAFKMLEEKYREAGFFIDVRLQLPDFVESNFMPSKEQQIDDTTAANLATQLLGQLEAKIAQIPNDPDKYMSKTKLSEMYDNLKVCNKQVKYLKLLLGIFKERFRSAALSFDLS